MEKGLLFGDFVGIYCIYIIESIVMYVKYFSEMLC